MSAFDIPRAAAPPERGLAFEVSGFGEARPARMQFPSTGSPGAARAVCEQEIALIDTAIWQEKIPFPPRIQRTRPLFTPSIRALAPVPGEPRSIEAVLAPAKQAEPLWARVPVLREVVGHLGQGRLAPLLDKIVEHAGAGRMVIVGEHSDVLARLLRWRGRDALGLQAGYGDARPIMPGLLQRPRKGSFLHWLAAGANVALANEAGDAGTIVFIGSDDFADDRAALADAGVAAPAIIHARLDAGRLAVIEESFRCAPAETVTAVGSGALPRISVITVSYNQAPYLEAAIRSVLDQNYPDLEYIIVDGGSSDGSIDIIERYRHRCARVVIEPDGGQSDALNKGFALASGDVLTWLCSDDLLEPQSLWRVGDAYRRHRADLLVGGCLRIGETRRQELQRHHCALPLGQTTQLDALDILRFTHSWQAGHYFYQPEVFFSRRIWEAAGGHVKRHLHYGMDYDLWLRMALAGATVRHIPPMLACSRVHRQQKTRDDHAWYHQFRQLMEEYRDLFAAIEAAAGKNSCASA